MVAGELAVVQIRVEDEPVDPEVNTKSLVAELDTMVGGTVEREQ